MNIEMIKRLVRKDWHFMRWALAAYVVAGVLSLVPIAFGGQGAFFAGSIALITVIISIGIHLTMQTVVQERSEHTLAFVMTLPVSPIDYTIAKLLANVLIFGTAWLILLIATIAVIASRGALPDGLIPFATAILMQLLAGYCLLLAVAIVSESMGWTIGAIIIGNLALQGVMYALGNTPAIEQANRTDVLVWSQPITGLLLAYLIAIVVMLALTFHLQSRKTDFL